nr:hypothetical protein [Nonomuraea wenchangensis]
MRCSDGRRRALQRQARDQQLQVLWHAPPPGVASWPTREPGQAVAAVVGQPALQRPVRPLTEGGDTGQRHAVLQVRGRRMR